MGKNIKIGTASGQSVVDFSCFIIFGICPHPNVTNRFSTNHVLCYKRHIEKSLKKSQTCFGKDTIVEQINSCAIYTLAS